MIDLHFHCLPGIDDGPETWDDAVALCRAAARDGVTKIIATPHVLRDPWINDDPLERDRLIAKLNDLLGGSPAILPGCEYWFSGEAVELLEEGARGPLTTLNRSKYLLMEFSPGLVPPTAEGVVHELSVMDVVPVIAHPERNLVFARDLARLAGLVERGAIVQVTAGSLLGGFGRPAQLAAEEMIRTGLAHVVASDSHGVGRRAPCMAAARDRVRTFFSPEVEEGLFVANPQSVFASEDLAWIA